MWVRALRRRFSGLSVVNICQMTNTCMVIKITQNANMSLTAFIIIVMSCMHTENDSSTEIGR